MSQPRILVNNISFTLPTGKMLFSGISLAFSQHKIGLVGRNGIGKSTLIKLILGELSPHTGSIQVVGNITYVPQTPILLQDMTVAAFLECEEKINALHRIANGSIETQDFLILNDEWDIEERVQECLNIFGLDTIPYDRPIKMLSGGETTRLLLAKAFLSDADFLLLDEPTNHLDSNARKQLYHAIRDWKRGLIVISHDRTLLNLLDEIIELNTLGVNCYGGNYELYEQQKLIETAAKEQQLHDAKKSLKHSQQTIQSSREKHEQKQSYGRDLRRSGSIDKLAANAKKGRSERTQNKLLIKEERLIHQAETELQSTKAQMEINEDIHVDLPATKVPQGKIILAIEDLSFSYSPTKTKNIIQHFSFTLQGPARIALAGDNGSGKTTLVKLILNQLPMQTGKIFIGTEYVKYLDQNASLLNPDTSILDNFLRLNPDANENDAYRSLAFFLFKNKTALKLIKDLSSGEKLRALLACVFMSTHPPQLFILDEPTNHLDLNSIKSIESALKNYQGAIIAISHDENFLNNIGIEKIIYAPFFMLK